MRSSLSGDATIPCRAVLFDLDGVLVDSRSVVERTWRRWATRHGLPDGDIVRRAHGRRTVETIRDVAPALDATAEVEWLAAAELADTDGLQVVPGANEAIRVLDPAHRAIVTSGGRALAVLRLRHVHLDIPGVLVAAEDVKLGKPAPEGYLLAARLLGVEARDCIVIEDTPAGIAAGRGAGARVIALTTTFPGEALGEADLIVSSLAALRFSQGSMGIEVANG